MNAPRIARVAVLGGSRASSEKLADGGAAVGPAAPDPSDHSPASASASKPSAESARAPEPPGRA